VAVVNKICVSQSRSCFIRQLYRKSVAIGYKRVFLIYYLSSSSISGLHLILLYPSRMKTSTLYMIVLCTYCCIVKCEYVSTGRVYSVDVLRVSVLMAFNVFSLPGSIRLEVFVLFEDLGQWLCSAGFQPSRASCTALSCVPTLPWLSFYTCIQRLG